MEGEKRESVPIYDIRDKKGFLLKWWSSERKTRTRSACWCASSSRCAMNYVFFNLISAPSVRLPPPPFLSSGTCRTQQPLHNTTKTISSCGSRLEYPPLLSPEHQMIIRGFMLGACIKLIAHTGNRARRITYRNGFHLALVLALENMHYAQDTSIIYPCV